MPQKSPLIHTTVLGTHTAALYSGEVAPTLTGAPGAVAVGSDVLFLSGAGRVTGITMHASYLALSGIVGNFYDASAPVSGGPIAASGHKPLFGTPGIIAKVASGDFVQGGAFVPLNIPFNSGLCYNSRSGQTGVTVHFQPEQAVARSGL